MLVYFSTSVENKSDSKSKISKFTNKYKKNLNIIFLMSHHTPFLTYVFHSYIR